MQQFAVASLTLGSLSSKCFIVLIVVRVFFFSHRVIILSAFKHVCPLFLFSTSFLNPSLGLGLFKMIKILRKLFVVWCGRGDHLGSGGFTVGSRRTQAGYWKSGVLKTLLWLVCLIIRN